jgi:hypothetical protein
MPCPPHCNGLSVIGTGTVGPGAVPLAGLDKVPQQRMLREPGMGGDMFPQPLPDLCEFRVGIREYRFDDFPGLPAYRCGASLRRRCPLPTIRGRLRSGRRA